MMASTSTGSSTTARLVAPGDTRAPLRRLPRTAADTGWTMGKKKSGGLAAVARMVELQRRARRRRDRKQDKKDKKDKKTRDRQTDRQPVWSRPETNSSLLPRTAADTP